MSNILPAVSCQLILIHSIHVWYIIYLPTVTININHLCHLSSFFINQQAKCTSTKRLLIVRHISCNISKGVSQWTSLVIHDGISLMWKFTNFWPNYDISPLNPGFVNGDPYEWLVIIPILLGSITGWWFQPLWKNMLVRLSNLPQFSEWK